MKIIIVDSHGGSPAMSGGADSALLRVGEPVFIEEPASDWHTSVAIALRISRLGTHIPLKHAARYYDALAAIHILTPDDTRCIEPYFRDRAFAPGSWIPLDAIGPEITFAVSRHAIDGTAGPGGVSAEATFTLEKLNAGATVAWLSKYMTFKTGDIIILGDTRQPLGAPVADTAVEASISGIPSLSVRIK